jgi:hypothetical protein
MLIPIGDLQLIWKRILDNINPHYISVVLFAALDVDSVCALRIITVHQLLFSEFYSRSTFCLALSRYRPTQNFKGRLSRSKV